MGDTWDSVVAAVGGGGRIGACVTYIRQEAPLGLAHAGKISRVFVGESPFLLFLGDAFVRGGIASFVQRFGDSSHSALLLVNRYGEHRERDWSARLRNAALSGAQRTGCLPLPPRRGSLAIRSGP